MAELLSVLATAGLTGRAAELPTDYPFVQERWSDSPFKSIPRYTFQTLLLVSGLARIVW